MSVYARVKAACKESGKSVSQLENELGFPRSSICKWDEHMPSVEKVYMVSKNLGKPIEYFLEKMEVNNAQVKT